MTTHSAVKFVPICSIPEQRDCCIPIMSVKNFRLSSLIERVIGTIRLLSEGNGAKSRALPLPNPALTPTHTLTPPPVPNPPSDPAALLSPHHPLLSAKPPCNRVAGVA